MPCRYHRDLVRTKSGSNPPSHTITLSGIKAAPTLRPTPSHYPPSYTISLVGLDDIGFFPQNVYVVLVCYNMSYNVNTFWKLRRLSLFSTNSTWDCPVRGHLRLVKIVSPETNHFLSTVQTDSARPDDNQRFLLLHPPTDRDGHSLSLNRPNDDFSTNDSLPILCLYPPQGHQVKNTNSGPMCLVSAWVQI